MPEKRPMIEKKIAKLEQLKLMAAPVLAEANALPSESAASRPLVRNGCGRTNTISSNVTQMKKRTRRRTEKDDEEEGTAAPHPYARAH